MLTYHPRTMPDPFVSSARPILLGDYAVLDGNLCVAVVQTEDAARRLTDRAVLEGYLALKGIVDTIDRLGTVKLAKMDAARAALAALEGRTA